MLLIWIIGLIALIFLCIVFLMSAALFRFAMVRYDRASEQQSGKGIALPAGHSDCEHYKQNARIWFRSQPWQELIIKNDEGMTLHGGLLMNGDEKCFALVIHGWTGTREEMGPQIRILRDLGYAIVAPDLRGHGLSDGKYFSFGWNDRRDMLLWLDKIISLGATNILVSGHSMGGATVMMLAGEPLPEQVKCMVEECGYSSVYDQFCATFSYICPKYLNFLRTPVLTVTSFVNKFLQGFTFKEASCVNQLKKATKPMLFIHGDADDFVPYWMLEKNYEACASEKEKLIVPGAAHCEAIPVNEQGVTQAIRAFALKYMQ